MDLSPLLRPRSIAVVGANERPDGYAANVLRNLDRFGFEGPVWGVNPNRSEALGRPCVPTVDDLPEPVDAVVVVIAAAGVPATLTQAARRGCGGAVVLSAGFGEVESGRPLERELREAAVTSGLPVCGPNGNGIVTTAGRAAMWGDSVPALEPGPVAMVSQSGNVAVNALGSHRGIAWHTLVSTGNQAVCDASDWLAALCEQDGVRSVALFLESEGDGPKLAEALARCIDAGVGVAVLKVGASDAGARAAAAHTGAVAGDHRVFRALVAEAGAAWARDPHELLELAKALSAPRARPRGGGGLAVLTCSGGDSGLAADGAQAAGLPLPPLRPETERALGELLPEAATIANPLDYTPLVWSDGDRLRRIVAAVGSDPGVDQLLILHDHPQDLAPESEASWAVVREALVAGALESSTAALMASTLPDLIADRVARDLGARGVPAIAGLDTALRCAAALRVTPGDPERLRAIASRAQSLGPKVDAPGTWLGEAEAKRLLADAGLPVPRGQIVESEGDCVRAARALGPVALKLSSPALRHKSEAGALALDLAGDDSVRAAYRRLMASPVAGGASVLVEQMVRPGVELLVAARADAVVPVLVLGLGGVWTEWLDDFAVVPLPADRARVERALAELRGAALLEGARGTDRIDVGAVADLAVRAGELLEESGLDVLELNPVVAYPDRCVALDATARLSGARRTPELAGTAGVGVYALPGRPGARHVLRVELAQPVGRPLEPAAQDRPDLLEERGVGHERRGDLDDRVGAVVEAADQAPSATAPPTGRPSGATPRRGPRRSPWSPGRAPARSPRSDRRRARRRRSARRAAPSSTSRATGSLAITLSSTPSRSATSSAASAVAAPTGWPPNVTPCR